MLFEQFFAAATMILAILIPVFSYSSFKRGYELGVKDWNTVHPDEPKTVEMRKPAKMSSASNDELRKYETILENIENYDGTDANQKEIK